MINYTTLIFTAYSRNVTKVQRWLVMVVIRSKHFVSLAKAVEYALICLQVKRNFQRKPTHVVRKVQLLQFNV